MRARSRLLSLLLILVGTSLSVHAEQRTYDFTGFIGSRTFLTREIFPQPWPTQGDSFTGSITIDTDYLNAAGLQGGKATFADAIVSLEVELNNQDQRFTFKRNVNGTGALTVDAGTHPGSSNNSGMQSITAAMQGDLSTYALGTVSVTLIGRAANRPIFNNGDVASWDLTDIPAQLWDLQFQTPVNAKIKYPLFSIGTLSSLTRRPDGEDGTDTYTASDFPTPLVGQPSGRTWAGYNGSFITINPNSSNAYYTDQVFAPAALGAYIGNLEPVPGDVSWLPGYRINMLIRSDFTFSGEISSTWRGSGNTLGIAYNIVDGAEAWYEIRLYPAGYAAMFRVDYLHNTRTPIATANLPASARVPACPTNTANCLTGIDAKFVLTRSDYNTTLKINGVTLFNNIRQTELGGGSVGVTSSYNSIKFHNFKMTTTLPKLYPAPSPNLSYVTFPYFVFSYDSYMFQPLSGSWSVSPGPIYSYVSGTDPLSLSAYIPPGGVVQPGQPQGVFPGPDYVLDTNLQPNAPTPTTGASAGLAYELVDARNYYDVALGDNGTATLYQTISGVRTAVVSAPWQGSFNNNWQLKIVRFQNKTSVEVDGQRIFNEVPQAPLATHNWGVTSSGVQTYFNFVSQYFQY